MTQRTLIVGWNKLLESLSAGLLSANDLNRALFWQLDPHKMDGLCAQAYNWISCRPAGIAEFQANASCDCQDEEGLT